MHEVIDVDNDDDMADLVLIGEKVGKSDKGKAKESIDGGYDHQNMVQDLFFLQMVDFIFSNIIKV